MARGKPFTKDDPRRHTEGAPKKKSMKDILEGLGAIIIKNEAGEVLEQYEGMERLFKEIVDVGIREKNPAMMKFIYQHMNMPQVDPELSEIKKQSEKARAAKLEIANEKARGELIPKIGVKRVLGEIFSITRSIYLSGVSTVSTKAAAIAGVKDDVTKMKINEIYDEHCYKTLNAIFRAINDYLQSYKAELIKEDNLLA